jgi:integrase
MRSKLTRSVLLDPAGSRVTLRAYAEQHLPSRDLRPKTLARYERTLAHHIYPALGDRPLRTIRHSDVQAFQTAMNRQHGPRHARDIVVLLRSLLRAAVLDGLLERNPATGLRLEPARHVTQPTPTWTDVARGLAVAQPDVNLMIALGAGCGLRASELSGLAVTDVDMLRRELRVERQLHRLGGRWWFGPPKTDEGARAVPVPRQVIDLLAAHLAGDWPPYEAEGGSHRLLLGARPVAGDTLANRVAYAARKADVVVTPHGLRRLYTTTLLEAGVPVHVVDELTGHRSAGMTLGVYAKVTPAAVVAARQAVEAAWPSDLLRAAR